MNTESKIVPLGKRIAANSAIGLSFIVALEFVIMISPFAFVFYAALNPFLLALNQSVLTRWLTAFFLPHMVVPPDAFLKTVRVLGSVAFLGGMLVFWFAPSKFTPASCSGPVSPNADSTRWSAILNIWRSRLRPGDWR